MDNQYHLREVPNDLLFARSIEWSSITMCNQYAHSDYILQTISRYRPDRSLEDQFFARSIASLYFIHECAYFIHIAAIFIRWTAANENETDRFEF